MDKVVGVSVKPPRRRCRADVSQTLPRSQPDTCLQTWASAQTLSDTPRRSQAAPRNGRTHLTFRGRVSWREGDAGSALGPEQERREQKPRRENEAPRQGGAAPALPAPRSPSHLHAGHSADTCLSNFPQAPRHIKPLYRAGTSFLFLRQNLPPWPSAQGLAGPPQGPAATPPVTVASAYAEQSRRDPLLARKWKPHLKVTETAGTAL